MNKYSTEFPIKDGYTVDHVLRLACKWITGSPHSLLSEKDLSGIFDQEDAFFELGPESITIGKVALSDFEIGGLYYIRHEENGLAWTSVMVTLKSNSMHLVNIQINCEALNTSVYLPFPRKPYFIKQLLEEIGGGKDDCISVLDKPHYLTEFDILFVSDLILGRASNSLPVVYISAGFDDKYVLDPILLANSLSGVAHVFVEPSRSFSYKLRTETYSRNVYGGSIGVYWPDGAPKKVYHYNYFIGSSDDLYKKIVKEVSYAVSNRRSKSGCNWLYLRECVAKSRYEQLKRDDSTELNDYIQAFDEEISVLKNRLLEAESEISRLKSELDVYDSDLGVRGDSLLLGGKEQDYYEFEIQDIIVDVLQSALRNSYPDSRRYHVLKDLLDCNLSSGEGARIREEIKKIFKVYVSMDSRVKSQLVRLGFDVSEEGKHYKLVFHGDDRYVFSVSKTSSDYRAGKNLVSIINNKLF